PRKRRLSGAISRRPSGGTLFAGWTQPNNRRQIDAESRKRARCLLPEGDVPDQKQCGATMKKTKSGSKEAKGSDSFSQEFDASIKESNDWRGETLAQVRMLIKQAAPD